MKFDEKEDGIEIYFLNNIIVDLIGMFVNIRREQIMMEDKIKLDIL